MSNELQISLHSEPNTALPGATVKPDSKRCMDKVRSLSDAFVPPSETSHTARGVACQGVGSITRTTRLLRSQGARGAG